MWRFSRNAIEPDPITDPDIDEDEVWVRGPDGVMRKLTEAEDDDSDENA